MVRATMAPRPLLVIRRARPIGEFPAAEAALAVGRRTFAAPIDGTRLGEVLEGLAPGLVAPGPPVTHWLPDLDGGPTGIASTDAGARFGTVVLGSHLVNVPDPPLREALLLAAARHAEADGRILVEHHPVDWATTAAESWSERDGQRLGMIEVQADPPVVSAVSVYEAGDAVVRQPFTARVLSEAELAAELARAGLVVRRRLSPTWLEAGPRSRRFAPVAP